MLEQLDKHMKKNLLLPHITYKINLRCTIDLNMEVKTVKILEENLKNTLDPSLSNNIFMTPKAQATTKN